MHVERNHDAGKAEAIRRVDTLLDGLMRRPAPGGVTIQDATKSWSGDTLHFSFKARKSFFGATLSGTIRISDHSVAMDCDLPGMVTTFISEEKIRATIDQQLDQLFPADAPNR